MNRSVAILLFLCITFFGLVCQAEETVVGPQSTVNPLADQTEQYPRIVLYSVSWCPHCKEAKEYLTSHNIPFTNRDVELDDNAMQELTGKYKSTGVPVIVIGNEEKVIKGFDREKFEKVLKEMSK
jgi:glutaredoxin 3